MRNLYKNEQSGRSMVEMLGVLAIIGVLSIGGISGYSKAMSKYRVNKTLDQISMLVMNIRSLFASSVNYKGLGIGTAIQMGIIPGDMRIGDSETEIINAYQGRVFLEPGNSGGANRSFIVQYTGLTQEACVSIATADWGSQAGSGLVSIGITSGTEKTTKATFNEDDTFKIEDMPIPLSDAAAKCDDDTETAGNAIQWEYY